MAYARSYEGQKNVGYETFIKAVENIEKNMAPSVRKYISGRTVYVLLNDNFKSDYFEKTTVSDLREVVGEINFNCLIQPRGLENVELYMIREPKKADFRGKIKFTPPGTLSLSARMIAPDDDGELKVCGFDKLPFLQDEKFVTSFCDEAYNSDEKDVDYDYLERHAFCALANDRRFKCSDDWAFTMPTTPGNISRELHRIICLLFDIKNSWGVCYEYTGNCFVFPMPREHIQDIFRKRDKENGRRKTIAAIVRPHERKGVQVDGHLRTAGGFTIDGREFSILVGAEDLERIFPDTDKSKKRVQALRDNLEMIGDGDLAYDKRKREVAK